MAVVLDGKALAALRKDGLRQQVAAWGHGVGLAVIQVGDNPASAVYVNHKIKACADVGMQSFKHHLPADGAQADIIALIQSLNHDPHVHGILVQLPLPAALDTDAVLAAIEPAKDVDGLHIQNAGRVFLGDTGGLVPCTPLGCMMLMDHYLADVPLRGKHAVVLGRSRLVGRPVASLLLQRDCTVTMAHSATQNLPALVGSADILVAAIGQPHFVPLSWIKAGAIVLDVGINRTDQGTLVGDVDLRGDTSSLCAYTPVPGGVGPMTVTCLLLNTFKAAVAQHNRKTAPA
ncbi:MAG: bifunctional 5,10-methylenetetrahydrofolate dehydrogenase/5,10-methenyltetrahydrofolate cyclohydrolase [Alphaproteobacteria bacterium]